MRLVLYLTLLLHLAVKHAFKRFSSLGQIKRRSCGPCMGWLKSILKVRLPGKTCKKKRVQAIFPLGVNRKDSFLSVFLNLPSPAPFLALHGDFYGPVKQNSSLKVLSDLTFPAPFCGPCIDGSKSTVKFRLQTRVKNAFQRFSSLERMERTPFCKF